MFIKRDYDTSRPLTNSFYIVLLPNIFSEHTFGFGYLRELATEMDGEFY